MIDCTENDDGTFTISWDANDPYESVLSTWTHDDFIQVIREECKKRLND